MTQPDVRAPDGPTSAGPGIAFVPGCLSSDGQLPDTPGYALGRSMASVVPLAPAAGGAASHGTGRPNRSYNRSTAG
jgi:hypothetical protein